MISGIKSFIKGISDFLTTEIWRIRVDTIPKRKAFLVTNTRVIILALRGYKEDKCPQKASALTFYTLLSIVPIVAMIFAIAKGFGIEEMLEKQLIQNMEGQEEVMEQVMGFAHNMLENTKGGIIAGVGIVMLFWSVMKVLGNIENSFNDIWNIKRSRSFMRKFSDYLSIMLVAPIFMIASSSLTIFISSQVHSAVSEVEFLTYLGPFITFLLKLLPYLLIWLLLTFMYIMMPNTKVKFGAAFLAGVIAGTLFQGLQYAYINFQVVISNYNTIYGSFAALPLLLIWLQASWLVVLLGAEISFAKQNVRRYEFEADSANISTRYKRVLSVLIMHLLVKNFDQSKPGMTGPEISKKLEIPIRLVREIIFELIECGLVSEIITPTEKEHAYQPGRAIDKLTIASVNQALDNRGVHNLKVRFTPEKEKLLAAFSEFEKTTRNMPENLLLKNIELTT